MLFIELIGVLIIALSVVYIYYKYVLFNFWRKKGIFYVEPIVPTGNLTDFVTGKLSVGKYLYAIVNTFIGIYVQFFHFSLSLSNPL